MYFTDNPTKIATKNQRAILALRTPFIHTILLIVSYKTLQSYVHKSKSMENPGQLAIWSQRVNDWSKEYKMRLIDIRR